MDTLDLSRIQFAANITFHILFPAITIGLAWFLVYFKLRHDMAKTADAADIWMRCYRFWVKLFALTFALGVVSGITMSFQFGTNWPGFLAKVGNIAGPLLGYEVLTAFFMEATFLGIMLFGMHRVPAWLHTAASIAVAIGTTVSSFWIIALNSWMHTPAGFQMVDGVAYATDWWAVVFNPSMPYRLVHVLLASGLTSAFLVAGISAYRIHQGDRKPAPRRALSTAIVVAGALIPLQIYSGDLHGLNTLTHQPAKIAAMEGVWETRKEAPFLIFALPDEATRTHSFSVGIPGAASWVLTGSTEGVVEGVNAFADAAPAMAPVFYSFRIMLATGFLMLAVAAWGIWRVVLCGELSPFTRRLFVAMTFSGWVGTLAGWYVTEMGRQPFLVTGVLRTADAVTTQPAATVGVSLAVYILLYLFLLSSYVGTLFYLARQSARLENSAEQDPAHATLTPPSSHTPNGLQV